MAGVADREGARHRSAANAARARKRDDRVKAWFAAVHESGFGHIASIRGKQRVGCSRSEADID